MSGPGDLYPQELLALAEDDSHQGELEPALTGEAKNPLCGDRIRVTVTVEEGLVSQARFAARGCAICKASGAKMAALVEGAPVDRALGWKAALEETVDRAGPETTASELQVFRGLRQAPSRKRCATLAWEALAKALA